MPLHSLPSIFTLSLVLCALWLLIVWSPTTECVPSAESERVLLRPFSIFSSCAPGWTDFVWLTHRGLALRFEQTHPYHLLVVGGDYQTHQPLSDACHMAQHNSLHHSSLPCIETPLCQSGRCIKGLHRSDTLKMRAVVLIPLTLTSLQMNCYYRWDPGEGVASRTCCRRSPLPGYLSRHWPTPLNCLWMSFIAVCFLLTVVHLASEVHQALLKTITAERTNTLCRAPCIHAAVLLLHCPSPPHWAQLQRTPHRLSHSADQECCTFTERWNRVRKE